jgi:hypothetical protein
MTGHAPLSKLCGSFVDPEIRLAPSESAKHGDDQLKGTTHSADDNATKFPTSFKKGGQEVPHVVTKLRQVEVELIGDP